MSDLRDALRALADGYDADAARVAAVPAEHNLGPLAETWAATARTLRDLLDTHRDTEGAEGVVHDFIAKGWIDAEVGNELVSAIRANVRGEYCEGPRSES